MATCKAFRLASSVASISNEAVYRSDYGVRVHVWTEMLLKDGGIAKVWRFRRFSNVL